MLETELEDVRELAVRDPAALAVVDQRGHRCGDRAGGLAALPADFQTAGALSGFPFFVIAVMAARRQRGQPSAAQVAETAQALGA